MAKVLIVDDEPFTRIMIRSVLESDGHSVVEELSDATGINEFITRMKPDLVTMDILMPKSNGIEAVREIRSMNPNLPVVMISELDLQPIIFQAVKAGINGYVLKPIVADTLSSEIKRIIERKSRATSRSEEETGILAV